MNPFWILLTTLVAAGCGCTVWLVVRLLSYRHAPETHSDEFTMERFQPMAALLSKDDIEFLASQPGVDRKEVAEFERDRRSIFRSYLTELAGEFHALHAQARQLAAAAPEQHADLVAGLLKQQVEFWMLLARLEIQLALAPMGVRVNAEPILNLVGSLGRAGTSGPVPVS